VRPIARDDGANPGIDFTYVMEAGVDLLPDYLPFFRLQRPNVTNLYRHCGTLGLKPSRLDVIEHKKLWPQACRLRLHLGRNLAELLGVRSKSKPRGGVRLFQFFSNLARPTFA